MKEKMKYSLSILCRLNTFITENTITLRRNIFSKTTQNEMTYMKNATENDVILSRAKDLIFRMLPKYIINRPVYWAEKLNLMFLFRKVSANKVGFQALWLWLLFLLSIPATAQLTTAPQTVRTNQYGETTAEEVILQHQVKISDLEVGDSFDVFPICDAGEYYVGFQLVYDLGDQSTEVNWEQEVTISLFEDGVELWTGDLSVMMETQTFVSTLFHEDPLACGDRYTFQLVNKTGQGAPEEHIYLVEKLYPVVDDLFSPSEEITVNIGVGVHANAYEASWNADIEGAISYELQWVYVDTYDRDQPASSADAFAMRAGAGVILTGGHYTLNGYYPEGQLYIRVRALGFNVDFPNYPLIGDWYYAEDPLAVSNHEEELSWQVVNTYAEEGKTKQVMQYLDGSMRQRQVLTNLNTDETVVIGESFFDFEGRASISILPVPVAADDLGYQENFNTFDVTGWTKANKYLYDNTRFTTNPALSTTSGAGQYYSSENTFYQDNLEVYGMIPDAEGYAYTQVAYLNDNTGRTTRQSGVGEIYNIDDGKVTRQFYGEASQTELVRLFGSNVGEAYHYRKNGVLDPNGQLSISYVDQEGRTIATALAGEHPENVEALPSLSEPDWGDLTIDISNKRQVKGREIIHTHTILNEGVNNEYIFEYDLSSLASDMGNFGCMTCSYDLEISITDPNGYLLSMTGANTAGPDNQSGDDRFYRLYDLLVSDCINPDMDELTLELVFEEIGSYTFTKRLVVHEVDLEALEALVRADPEVQQEIQIIEDSYVIDPTLCEFCDENCDEQGEIEAVIAEVAIQDCENIRNQIIEDLREANGADPTEEQIEAHDWYCEYEFCVKNTASAEFDMEISLISWEEAEANPSYYYHLEDYDPFFNDANLSGHGDGKSTLDGYLGYVLVAVVNDINYGGSLLEILDYDNTDLYFDGDGNLDPSGFHLLYHDPQSIGASENELKERKWALYKGFYTDFKRKVKLGLGEVSSCSSLRGKLEAPDEMPIDEEGIGLLQDSWGIYGDISDTHISNFMTTLATHCGNTFSDSDKTIIEEGLREYFNADAPYVELHYIYYYDLTVEPLKTVNDLLFSQYGCGLEDFAVYGNPISKCPCLTCKEEEIDTIIIDPGEIDEDSDICIDYYIDEDFLFTFNSDEVVAACIERLEAENLVLIEYATEKLISEKMSELYNVYTTNCIRNAKETITYTYAPKEYHYTLYYYDQAGDLVQTIPPRGVHPLNSDETAAFIANGGGAEPRHELKTRYQYNSLGQLIWQNSPDGGTTRFLYDGKGQLRLSQNEEQAKAYEYSYSQYDELGRIVEVGEYTDVRRIEYITQEELDDADFPSEATYELTDITRTYYDRPAAPIQPVLSQKNLRSRVSYSEVLDTEDAAPVATYYSYDAHGNVHALLQDIPGLGQKRIDYDYDLVSGNVNHVIYQYGAEDQFYHRYTYDADNRIQQVETSHDGYIWTVDAVYEYYPHGPLQRIELGDYKVQGLDYYYSLQGWLKGVNMPGGGEDPGNDGVTSGRDEMAFILGYHEGDYQPIGGTALPGSQDRLWTRYDEQRNTAGLYNGNIAWMGTDIPEVGRKNENDATQGYQAMLYHYDQLNRIVAANSLTNYEPATGFGARGSVAEAYDAGYTYDPNGNIMTLNRHDAAGDIQDEYTYLYDPNNNRLMSNLEEFDGRPVPESKVYDSDPFVHDGELYQNITLASGAVLPDGTSASITATKSLVIEPGTLISSGSTFEVDFDPITILGEPQYEYDAIGNLVRDNDQETTIAWTTYGKVRSVTKDNGDVTSFKYNAAGNRIEKQVTQEGVTTTTHYMRDVSGNVMAIYRQEDGTPPAVTEQPIYGSSRLGNYLSEIPEGTLQLGHKHYELSNHLGNVLAVVSDNINMAGGEATASVVSTSDYYPFGLQMTDRTITSEEYRYGFNGKEKDQDGEWGSQTNYDYGARVYNPSIGRFLSVDPELSDIPDWAPYTYARNLPTLLIDLRGEFPTDPGIKYFRKTTPQINQADRKQMAKLVAEAKRLVHKRSETPTWLKKFGRIPFVSKYVRAMVLVSDYVPTPEDIMLGVYDNYVNAETNGMFPSINEWNTLRTRRSAMQTLMKEGIIVVAEGKPIEIFTDDPSTLGDDYLQGVIERLERGEGRLTDQAYADEAYSRLGSRISASSLSSAGCYGKCQDFAGDFVKTYGGTRYAIDIGKYGLIGTFSTRLSDNGYHEYVEITIGEEVYIYDNLHANGILKSDYIKEIEGYSNGKFISGEELLNNATKID